MRDRIIFALKSRITMTALGLMAAIQPALAWDGVVSGNIYAVEITGGNNFGFRVYVTGVASMCGSAVNWAYLNETDSNYRTYVAAILTAKAQGSQVTVFTTQVSGYCQIGYVSIQ